MPATFSPDIARALFDTLDQIHLVYIHPDLAGGARGHDFGTDVDAALAEVGDNIPWEQVKIDLGWS